MVPWGWVVVIAILSGTFGMMCMAILAVGGSTDDWNDGYQCGRGEACEHVRAAEHRTEKAEESLKVRIQRQVSERGAWALAWEGLVEDHEAQRSEIKLLRGMALGEGEDV